MPGKPDSLGNGGAAVFIVMHENTLLKIALCCILVGLPLLYILSDYFSIDGRVIDRVTGSDIGFETVTGKVTKIRNSEKLTTLTVKETKYINILVFDNISVPKNVVLKAKGRLDNMTLIADEVRIG